MAEPSDSAESPQDALVGPLADFAEPGTRRVVRLGGEEIAVFRVGPDLVAFENSCPHQGGPIALGLVTPRVEARVTERGAVEEEFSATEHRIVCPWHAWEFDPHSGRCAADPRMGLRPREVVVKGDDVYVR